MTDENAHTSGSSGGAWCPHCRRYHFEGPCPTPLYAAPLQPAPQILGPFQGCICPPGSNLTCQNPMCPRKGGAVYYGAPALTGSMGG